LIAALLAAFLDGARASLEIALYDLRLGAEEATPVAEAISAARSRGVAIRLAFNQDHPRHVADPPPPAVDWDLVKRLGVEWAAIPGVPDLMHHKYVVRDAGRPGAAVWTGSSNWTTDSWTREENVIVRVLSAELAGAYHANFEELWERRQVRLTGHQPPAWFELQDAGRVRAYFTPGRAPKLVHEISQRLATARRRIRICSPVLTSGPILGTLAEVVRKPGLDIAGCYDATQMDEVMRQWSERPESNWKLAAFRTVAAALPWGAKRSPPYEQGSVHDFMHAKCLVADDTVFVGSYNLSHSGEENAENVLEFAHPGLAELFTGFIDRVAGRYRPTR